MCPVHLVIVGKYFCGINNNLYDLFDMKLLKHLQIEPDALTND